MSIILFNRKKSIFHFSIVHQAKTFFCVVVLLFFLGSLNGVAQSVYKKVLANFTGVAFGESRWVDLDNDNDLDLILAGQPFNSDPVTKVYENTDGIFTERSTILSPMHWGSVVPGDYDKDGDTDLIITGSTSLVANASITALYRNEGGFTFTKQKTFEGLSMSFAAWIDADNDQDLDIILTGILNNDLGSPATFFYQNTETGFVKFSSGLPTCYGCAIDVADANGDGKSDVFMTGVGKTGLYLGNGNKTFTAASGSVFKQLTVGAGRWGDFDADGDLDLLLTGLDDASSGHSIVYENKNGKFTERTDIKLLGMWANANGGTRWIDFNNDGKLDILLSGRASGANDQTHRVYKNNGNGTFTQSMEAEFDPLDQFSFDAGDFDNDGDLDLSFLGYLFSRPQNAFAGYFKNTVTNGTPGLNSKPEPPSSSTFSEKCFRRSIQLKWGSGSDVQTPAPALNYNFYLRNETKKIILPAVDFTTGYLQTVNQTNGYGRVGFAYDLEEGPLYYAVQSIDGSKEGSVFSAEKMFYHFNGPETVKAEIIDDDDVKLTWIDHSSVETNFNIARSTSVLTGFVPVATPSANVVTHTDHYSFATDTYYYYRINGYNASHSSYYDSLTLVIPKRATDVKATSINASTVELEWTDQSSSETGFVVERKKSSASIFQNVAVLSAGVQFYKDTGLEQGTLYDYRVRAISANGGLTPTEIASTRTNYLPIGTNFSKDLDEEADVTLTKDDFLSHFTDQDVSDQLVRIKIISLPLHGTIKVSGLDATVGMEVNPDQFHLITFTPDENFAALTAFAVSAHDGKDYSVVAWTIAFNVRPVNDAPAFEIDEEITIEEDFGGRVLTLSPVEVPYELGTTSYSFSANSTAVISAAIDQSTGELTLTSLQDIFGTTELTVTANDGQSENATFSRVVKVIVTPVNDAPVLGPIAGMSVDGGLNVSPVKLTVSDVDNALSVNMFSAHSENQAVLKDQNITFSKDASGDFFMHLDPEPVLGTTNVVVTVNDGALSSFRNFTFDIFMVTSVDEDNDSSMFRISPNPVAEVLSVSVEQQLVGRSSLTIIDPTGRSLVSVRVKAEKTELRLAELLPGVYYVNLRTDKGNHVAKKVIKR